jgi:hypothetical protein
VTTDAIDHISDINTSLKKLSKKPTTRVVFDEFMPATNYVDAVRYIHGASFIMGEILDSMYVSLYSVAEYLARTTEYLNALGNDVDIWEVGNEINGEWLGTTADVVAKMSGAYDLVKARNKTTELTLYYNQDCWENPANEMFTWAQANVPARMKTGLDYVLVSFYDEDCPGVYPNWNQTFQQLGNLFPNSKIGFGEVGSSGTTAQKEALIRKYYSLYVSHPRYVGGYFWWYFKQDMVPYTKYLWSVLNSTISSN